MRTDSFLVLFGVLLGFLLSCGTVSDGSEPKAAPAPLHDAAESQIQETNIPAPDADRAPASEPDAPLLWNKQNVPPLCFDKLVMGESRLTEISIPACEAYPEIKVKKTYFEQGWYQSDYAYAGYEDEPDNNVMYRVVGTTSKGSAVKIINYTGGSGRFSSMVLVKVEGDTLKLVEYYTGGDRCNGGIREARVEGDDVLYGVNITPYDFIPYALGEDTAGLQAYEDLESSAASCYAIAWHRNHDFYEVELDPEAGAAADPDWVERYKYQACFNSELKKVISSGKLKLSQPELKSFVEDFLKACKK